MHFFKDQLFWFLEHTQDFEVAVSGPTKVKGLKPPSANSLRKFYLEIRAFKLILNLTWNKEGVEGDKQFNSLKLLHNFSYWIIYMASKSVKCD